MRIKSRFLNLFGTLLEINVLYIDIYTYISIMFTGNLKMQVLCTQADFDMVL